MLVNSAVACATEICWDLKKKELKCVQFYGSTTMFMFIEGEESQNFVRLRP
jgi:hypothetical protein